MSSQHEGEGFVSRAPWGPRRTPPVMSAEEAVQLIKDGDRVYIHEAAMAPVELLEALANRARAEDITGIETVSMHTEGPAPHVAPDIADRVRHLALFAGANVRQALAEGRADYIPVFLSDVPTFIRSGSIRIDVALIQVSPPDRHGYCRLGTSIACARSAVDTAPIVIGLINPQVPRTLGNCAVHISRFAAFVETDRPIYESHPVVVGPVEDQIGANVAPLIPDRATIQVGIGAIPDAVLDRLDEREDLGVHTEMFSDGIVRLAERGVITNQYKERWRGRIVTSFVVGSRRVYDFVDGNPFVEFHPSDIVNDTREIRLNSNMISLNSAIEIDLTGQVVADSIGPRIFSGIGGQMDFVRGASLSPGGKAVIALPATAANGSVSRIVSQVKPGAGVVTTRGHVQYVATEYGVVNLSGQPLRRRAELLISIAHPDVRAELLKSLARPTISVPGASPAHS